MGFKIGYQSVDAVYSPQIINMNLNGSAAKQMKRNERMTIMSGGGVTVTPKLLPKLENLKCGHEMFSADWETAGLMQADRDKLTAQLSRF